MRYVALPVPAAPVSVLGFGCAALLGRAGRRESLAALAAAWDAGITFYDTARSYGYGASEGLLGEFLRGRRDQAVVCTKFGILPPAKGGWKQKVKPLARAAVRLFPGLRKAAQRAAGGELQAGHFSVDVLHASLEASLRALGMDSVDMLLLHAAPASVLAQDDLLDALERLVAAGKVRMAGISGEQSVLEATFTQRPAALTTAQFAVNLSNLGFTQRTRAERGLFLVANHPYGGPGGVAATRASIDALRTQADLPAALREKLTPGDPQLMPELVLHAILEGTGIDAVVPAMMQPKNLLSNARALEHCRFTPEELARLRVALTGPANQASAGL